MFSFKTQLCILALVSACVCEAVEKTYNLKSLERRMEAHAKHTAKRGEDATVSDAFKTVQEGMKKGNYHYDLKTAREVAREVHAHLMPAGSKFLQEVRNK